MIGSNDYGRVTGTPGREDRSVAAVRASAPAVAPMAAPLSICPPNPAGWHTEFTDLYIQGQAAIEKSRQTNTGRKQPPGWVERSISWKIGNKSRTGMPGSRTGCKHSPETCIKMSESAVKRIHTDEGKQHVISAGKRGGAVSWSNPDSRWKMFLRDWHMMNVRTKNYWGA